MKQLMTGVCGSALALLLTSCTPAPVPIAWAEQVQTEGQELPIPRVWLDDAEARSAHSLKLPDRVPTSPPFDFDRARWRAWLPNAPSVASQYFSHLCSNEAGEWIFKTVKDVEGLYFARPQGAPASGVLADRYGPEMPWIQRLFVLQGDKAHDWGTWFIQPPIYNYRFVEQPQRNVKWQAGINQPYIRLSGYTRGFFVREGQVVAAWNEKTPMQVDGIVQPSARYGYTWRGIVRPLDRKNGIAGGEVIIYDLRTKEVLAVRRQFLITGRIARGPGDAAWEVAASCRIPGANTVGLEFKQFSFDVLQTAEPSTTQAK